MKGLTVSPFGSISEGSIQKLYNKSKPSLTPAGVALVRRLSKEMATVLSVSPCAPALMGRKAGRNGVAQWR